MAATLAGEAAARDADGAFPAASFQALREAGLLTASLPTSLGGQGVKGAALLTLLRQIGRASLPVGRVYEGHVNALGLIQRYGTSAQLARAARDADRGELFGVWNTEDGPGLRLEAGPGGLTLVGGKTFASGLGHVTRPLLPAEAREGRMMVLLPTGREPGVPDPSFWQPLGMRATVSGRVDYSGARVQQEDLIGQPGDYYRQPEFGGGALRFLAVQLGGAGAVVASARAALRELGRAGDDVQRLRFAEVAVRLEAAWQVTREAQRRLDALPDGADPAPLLAYVALARTATEDACLLAAEAAERAVGARGLLAPWPTERLLRDLRMYLRQPAPDAARLAVGAWLLDAPDAGDPWEEA
ncbi:alkylation response protein AidB-like acyl-CoA dehydrogenase [Deinococcus budaensis]|uniref:Alkylation response protein AidB-like acyl-CoA dehydrogenase n=1 Tax=Deinococcus budaensis TaxID=1665626 RepID=A0A7W8GI66_9DEIO|nr:alkylation response protein AidB-like acyl-CoA dehydrogenase [Deinococcus budaensis]